jgi:broad specificity phosphatase PhoE
MAQGRGEDKPGEPNGLTPQGVMQIEAAVPAFAAAGFTIRYVSSSALTRAIESAATFINASPDPKPTPAGIVALGAEHGLKEISQKGWEKVYDREQRAQVYHQKLSRFMGKLALTRELTREDINGYVAWVVPLGDEGESPLGGALRGILALEEHGLKPGELIFSHGMLNRYMGAIATIVDSRGRERLYSLLAAERSVSESIGTIAVIKALKELGVKDFKTHDDAANHQANGSAIEYTVEHASGLWIAGRRIEPLKPRDKHPYVEHRRNAKTAQWKRVTAGEDDSGANE